MSAHDDKPPKDIEDPSRTEQAGRAIEEYAEMLRQLIKSRRKRLN